jgi:phage shock protein A
MQKEYLMNRLTTTLSIIAIVFLIAGPAISKLDERYNRDDDMGREGVPFQGPALQQDVATLKQQSADKDIQIAALQQDVAALKQQLAALEGNYSDIQIQIADIQQRCCPQQALKGIGEKLNQTAGHQQKMREIEKRLNKTAGHQQVMKKIEKKLNATGAGLNLTFGDWGNSTSLHNLF